MNQYPRSVVALTKKPSAFLPLAMSLTALATLGGAYIFGLATGHGGLVREPDEGVDCSHLATTHGWTDAGTGVLRD